MSRRSTVADPGVPLSYALRLANRGYSADQIRRALLDHHVVRHLQERAGFERVDAFARQTAERAVDQVRKVPSVDWPAQVVVRVAERRLAADSVPWPGRTGPTDRRVLEGAFLTASICKSVTFNMAVRTWGMRVGLPWSIVATSVKRLRHDRSALELVSRGGSARTSKYRIRSMVGTRTGSSLTQLFGDLPPLSEWGWLAHDAFRSAALGDPGWMVTRWLRDDDPRKASDLAAATGIERHRAYAVLGRLQHHEIATKAADGWVRIPDSELVAALDLVAVMAGTAGSLEADRRRYEQQRQGFAKDHPEYADAFGRRLTVPVPTIADLDELEARARVVAETRAMAEQSDFDVEKVVVGG